MPQRPTAKGAADAALLVLAVLLVLATALPALPTDAWWARAFDYPRLQVALAGALVLALYAALRRPGRPAADALAGALLLAVLFQGYTVFPYTPLAREEVVSHGAGRAAEAGAGREATLSLLVANVLLENREAARFLDVVRAYDPDLVLVLEPDARWTRDLRALEGEYPHAVVEPLDNTYGMALYSRLELVDPEVRYLVEPDVPSVHARVRLRSGHLVRLHAVHPDPPNPAYATRTTERDGELLLVGEEVRESGGPTVVAGDFNDVPWSRTTRLFRETSGLLDPRVGRGPFSTYHAGLPGLRWPLDHAFHSDHFRLVRFERGPAFGSDHFPLFVELAVDPAAEWEQVSPTPEVEDVREAREAIEDAGPRERL